MIIRSYSPSDSVELAELFYTTIREVNIQNYSEEQVKAWAPENRDLDEWQRTFEGKSVFIAVEAERILGFSELEPNGHIDRFYIHKDAIGKGVGKNLYLAIEEYAKSLGLKQLLVEASITAKPFFERMQFINSQEQIVLLRGVEFINYRMEKFL